MGLEGAGILLAKKVELLGREGRLDARDKKSSCRRRSLRKFWGVQISREKQIKLRKGKKTKEGCLGGEAIGTLRTLVDFMK